MNYDLLVSSAKACLPGWDNEKAKVTYFAFNNDYRNESYLCNRFPGFRHVWGELTGFYYSMERSILQIIKMYGEDSNSQIKGKLDTSYTFVAAVTGEVRVMLEYDLNSKLSQLTPNYVYCVILNTIQHCLEVLGYTIRQENQI